jgi:hypothetical protein
MYLTTDSVPPRCGGAAVGLTHVICGTQQFDKIEKGDFVAAVLHKLLGGCSARDQINNN